MCTGTANRCLVPPLWLKMGIDPDQLARAFTSAHRVARIDGRVVWMKSS